MAWYGVNLVLNAAWTLFATVLNVAIVVLD